MKPASTASLLIAAAVFCAAGTAGFAAERVFNAGILRCQVMAGTRVNLLIRSTADITCSFENNGVIERYQGETGIAIGLDLSFRKNQQLTFSVVTARRDLKPGLHGLAGKYIGGQISAAAGLGLGAKALVGGGRHTIGLQPLALETSTGIGIAGGLGFLYLEPKPDDNTND